VKRGRKPGDHNAMRTEIAEAACKAILRLGIANAGLADIAREMGYTTGVLRHYFEDKESLLLFAKNMLFDRASARARQAAEGASGTERLRIMVVDSLRLDAETVDRWRLLAIFSGRAIGDARLMAIQQRRNERFWRLLEEELTELQKAGYLSSRADVALEARGIVAFSDGLADQVIMKPKAWTTAQLQTLIAGYLDSMLSRCVAQPRPAARH
jgi:TetR/AcrR family transcriptional regulator, transcriptional repressor of aconitase